MRNKILTISLISVSILALALAAAAVALAYPGQASAQAGEQLEFGPGHGFNPGGPGGFGPGPQLDTYLAEALGISVEDLQVAQQAAYQKALDLAVEKGLITEEQATAMKEKETGFGRRGPGLFGKPGSEDAIDLDALLAEELGISTEDLQAARQKAQEAATQAAIASGKMTQEQADQMRARQAPKESANPQTLLAEALGISVEELQSAQQAAHQKGLDLAVAQGLITEEQAAKMKNKDAGFDRRGPGLFGKPGSQDGIDADALLAEELGISVEDLQAARQKAQEASIQASIEAGVMTQEQADLMKAREALKAYIDPQALMAQALGVSVDELQAARQEGKTMQDLIQELGKTEAEVQEAYQAAFKTAVQQAVADGVITQAQADEILSHPAPMMGPEGHGDFHGRPGGGGFFSSQPYPPASTPTPEVYP